ENSFLSVPYWQDPFSEPDSSAVNAQSSFFISGRCSRATLPLMRLSSNTLLQARAAKCSIGRILPGDGSISCRWPRRTAGLGPSRQPRAMVYDRIFSIRPRNRDAVTGLNLPDWLEDLQDEVGVDPAHWQVADDRIDVVGE